MMRDSIPIEAGHLTTRVRRALEGGRATTRSVGLKILLVTVTGCLAAACNAVAGAGGLSAVPTPIPMPSITPLPAAQAVFNVTVPVGTPGDAKLAMVLLDEVTGWAYNTRTVPMNPLGDNRWQAIVTPPVGVILRYHYIRQAPGAAEEIGAFREPITYRVAHIPGPSQFDDVIAAWSDSPYQGPTGRVVGRLLDAVTALPLPEMVVNIAGKTVFTDGEGRFRIDGLPPGLHNLTAFSTDGAYQTVQQGAVVAAHSATPAELRLQPAMPVSVTFQLTAPEDTTPGGPVRLVGNLRQFGHLFAEAPGGLSATSSRMPTMIAVDGTHYIFITQLYAGTDLRYRYTLGDGLWNAERDENGFFVTRQLIVPDHEVVLEDTVSTWNSRRGSVKFQVSVPEDTPLNDWITLQFNPFTWFEPLPMWRTDEHEWSFVLHGPLDFEGVLGYRFCRNFECGGADDVDTFGPATVGRQITPAVVSQDLRDTVRGWRWWGAALPPSTVIAPEITPRAGFEVGVEYLPDYRPWWSVLEERDLEGVMATGANAVTLTPAWVLLRENPTPVLGFDPRYAPFTDEIRRQIGRAGELGLQVVLRPSILWPGGEVSTWWSRAGRDQTWWTVWFEMYRSFVLTHARLAESAGVAKLVLGGPEVRPALPGGTLIDGSPSLVPGEAEALWRELIEEVRSIYSGRLAFEIELSTSLMEIPLFIEAFDEVHVYWHAPLGGSAALEIPEMQRAAAEWLDETLLSQPALDGIPVVLSVEYLSLEGGATACAKAPDFSCRPPSAFDQGRDADHDLPVDLWEQAAAFNAVLLEAYARPEVAGFYARRYNPIAALQDKSGSVNGKPAQDVLWYWYPRITGAVE